MRIRTLVSDAIPGYQTVGICGRTRRRSVSGLLARHCPDTDQPFYLSSAIGMPDLHKGDRFPIGCAIVAEGIYPALIGSDIGCGIALYPLGRIPSHLTPEKLASRLYNRNLDGPWDGSPRDWLARYGVTRLTEFDESLGTVGAGNHFAEICKVDRIVDSEACGSIGLREGEIYLLGELLRVIILHQSYH
jgi:tRNA-splicing ligase RtcB